MLRLSTAMRNGLLGSQDLKTMFTDGVLEIYTGTQPTSADDAETGTKLLRITVASGAFTPGAAGNGLEFGTPAAGKISKASGEVWSGAAVASGTAGWFRFYNNDYETGDDAGATKERFDGSCGTSGAELNLSSTSITSGATTTIDQFDVTFPAS